MMGIYAGTLVKGCRFQIPGCLALDRVILGSQAVLFQLKNISWGGGVC